MPRTDYAQDISCFVKTIIRRYPWRKWRIWSQSRKCYGVLAVS